MRMQVTQWCCHGCGKLSETRMSRCKQCNHVWYCGKQVGPFCWTSLAFHCHCMAHERDHELVRLSAHFPSWQLTDWGNKWQAAHHFALQHAYMAHTELDQVHNGN